MNVTIETLRRINASFIHNHITNDVVSHDQLLHSAFICISSSGQIIDRKSYLQAWATLFDPVSVPYWDTRDESIAVFGNTALVRASNKWTELRGSERVTGMTCYTDTYVMEADRWFCVQAQLTHVDAAHWPSDETIINIYKNGQLQHR